MPRGFGRELAQMDRDAQARRDRDRKLEERPVDRLAPRHQNPTDAGGRRLAATPLESIVQRVIPFPIADRPRTRAELARDRVVRLEELEDELTRFLAKCAPATWADARRALWRILRRARRELRAAERSASPAETAAERAAGR